MGLFDSQLKSRVENDWEVTERSLKRLSSSVLGKRAYTGGTGSPEDAVQEIFSWFKIKPQEPPSLMTDFDERLEYMLNPTGIMRRNVKLSGEWWKDAYGPMLAFEKNGKAIALFPKRFTGYEWVDHRTGTIMKANKNSVKEFAGNAICFYRPLPLKELYLKDLFRFLIDSLDTGDISTFVFVGILASLFGLVTPLVTRLIFGTVIPSGNSVNLAPAAILAVGMVISTQLMELMRNFSLDRISQKMQVSVENAMMGRLLNLPAQFFRDHSAGELQSRVGALSNMCQLLEDAVFSSAVSSVFSIVYLFQIYVLAPSLALPATGILLMQLAVLFAGIWIQARTTRKKLAVANQLNGLVYRLFSGIQKIKLVGAERRAFSKWAECYSKEAELIYNPPMFLKLYPALSGIITLAGSIWIYSSAALAGISQADYMAFTSAYGLVSGSMLSLAAVAESIANIKPLMEMAEPIMKAVPEIGRGKKTVTHLSGGVELSNVSFRYTEEGPWILDHVNLKIRNGEYVAIVGKTGCGKSTLMRLLLGFETPDTGAVYYDNRDLESLDLHSLRRNIGVVLQNSKLFTGDIYSNISISAPGLKMEEAWEAARMAGLDEDIRKMPMGMQTLIMEGGGGLSGGQRQRLMIARAIAARPRILMFDEATSALDNVTQRVVSESLDALKCTRLVIAHRLSTVRHCDRILVLDNGKIVEDGTYEELVSLGGVFAELVRRQTLNV